MGDKIMNDAEKSFVHKQKEIWLKYCSEFAETKFNKFIGVAIESFDKFKLPVNGLRHPDESEDATN